jgi:hypothetical protein
MIWGEKFVWTHLGRTGGNSVDLMFRILNEKDIHLDPRGGESADWYRHQTVEQREKQMSIDLTTNHLKILNFRRLPNWVLSFAEFKYKYQNIPFSREDIAQGKLKAESRNLVTGELDQNQYNAFNPDDMLLYYGFQNVYAWLRTESIAEDFISTFSQWYDITPTKAAEIRGVHDNQNTYNNKLSERFTNSEIGNLYDSCPIWTELEKEIYGDLLLH